MAVVRRQLPYDLSQRIREQLHRHGPDLDLHRLNRHRLLLGRRLFGFSFLEAGCSFRDDLAT